MPNPTIDKFQIGNTTYDFIDSTARNTADAAVPQTRKVNNKALSADVTLTSDDIGYDSTETYSSGTIGNELTQLSTAITQMFDDAPKYIAVPFSEITEKTNTFVTGSVGNSPTENTNSNWRTMTMSVTGGNKYRVTARFYSSIKGVFFVDSDNKILQIDGSESSDTSHTLTVTAPNTAVTMIINDKKSNSFNVEDVVEVLNNDLIYIGNEPIDEAIGDVATKVGVLTGDNIWTIGTGKMKTVVNLYGSQNGLFNYQSLSYDNNIFKGVGDDISPISTEFGYLGGNHGLNAVYDATLANHGLTTADIGKTCEIDGDTWVLLKIKSSSVFVVACVADNVIGVKTVSTAPTTFNFGSSITVTSISLQQLKPCIKNTNISVVKNNSNVFEVAESYDIVSLVDGITYIREHVGTNTNDTIINESSPIITIRNLYSFTNNSACVITQNAKILSDELMIAYYGGTQSNAFDVNTEKFSVPMTSNGTLASISVQTDFSRSTWNDSNTPPIIYCQTDNSGNTATRMMVQGILVNNRNDLISSSAGFVYTTKKLYPYAVQPNAVVGEVLTYNIISFRLPIYKGEMSDKFEFCNYCKIGNAYYFFCFSSSAASDSIVVPSELCGKKIETVMAENATCNNILIADSIDVISTGESYLLLKLTD